MMGMLRTIKVIKYVKISGKIVKKGTRTIKMAAIKRYSIENSSKPELNK